MKIPNKILNYITLVRLDKPIGIYLLYFPCVFGLGLGYTNLKQFLHYAVLFFIGSVLMRAGGCIINDIFDRDLDINVDRTKNRPIACGKISIREAITILTILLILSLCILLQFNTIAITIALISVINVILYPLMKRWTYWPQVWLGITFNIGVLIGYSSLQSDISFNVVILYFGCIFWTLGYDTIYAFMDIKDDIKTGIKSSAIAIKSLNYRLILICFYSIFIISIAVAIPNYREFFVIILLLLATIMLLWQVLTLNIHNPHNCLVRFKSNQYAGVLVAMVIFFSNVLYT